MKRILLFALLLLPQLLQAQELYSRPFSEDHKVWLYQIPYNPLKYHKEYFTEGDTIIDGRVCLKVYLRQEGKVKYDCSIYDEGRRTFVIDPGQTVPRLLYDFGVTTNDEITVLNGIHDLNLRVEKDTLIESNGSLFKVLTMYNIDYPDNPSDPDYFTAPYRGYWIEGIGGSTRYFPYSAWWDGFNHMYFCACFVDGELVFNDDSYVPVADAIVLTASSPAKGRSPLYDFSGRRVITLPESYTPTLLRKGIYIMNGKKVVVK